MFFKQKVVIDNITLGKASEPYVIAEMSANHANDINYAKKIIAAASKAGASAVKIQTYTPDTLTLNCKSESFKAKGAWKGRYLYDLYNDAYMPWEWTAELLAEAKKENITLFSSPFDPTAVDFLEDLNMPAYKIASPEIIDLPLIKYIAETKKPIILSSGGANFLQINEAVEVIKSCGNKELIILKCTSEYPAPLEKINLLTIKDLEKKFGCIVGISDHTIGTDVPIASIALGASVIEKHFILDKETITPDSFFSATPDELKSIVSGSKNVYKALGKIDYPDAGTHQRSLIAIKDISKGDKLIGGQNFKSLRPGGGIEPKYFEKVNSMVSKKNIAFGTLLTWDLLSSSGNNN